MGEELGRVRPAEHGTIRAGGRALPVLGRYDVVVVGGGTSGAPAGIAAAKSGAKTLVIEYLHELGGVGTVGLIAGYWYGVRKGYTEYVDSQVNPGRSGWNAVEKAEWLRRELTRHGADVWFGVLGCGALCDGGQVRGVVVATPQGRAAVLAETVIDATGNGDIAACAGAPTQYSISDHGSLNVQIAGFPERPLKQSYVNTCYTMVDDTDVLDVWHLMVWRRTETRQVARLRRGATGRLARAAPHRGRLHADRRGHPGPPHLSRHDQPALQQLRRGRLSGLPPAVGRRCEGPLLPRRPALPLPAAAGPGRHPGGRIGGQCRTRRDDPDPHAGRLAEPGLCRGRRGGRGRPGGRTHTPHRPQAVQQQLVREGVLAERVATDKDSFPASIQDIERAVQTLGDRDQAERLASLAVIMAHSRQAIPLLQQRYRDLPAGPEQREAAKLLGLLGDPTGVPALVAAVDAHDRWDQGLALTSQRKTGNTFSELDRLVIALGFSGAPEALAPLLRKLGQLEPDSELSHYKAISLALWDRACPAAAEPLAKLLDRPGFTGHTTVQPVVKRSSAGRAGPAQAADRLVTTDSDEAANRTNLNRAMKELMVAALLFRCGDRGGRAEAVLQQYARDIHGHFARYASGTLNRPVPEQPGSRVTRKVNADANWLPRLRFSSCRSSIPLRDEQPDGVGVLLAGPWRVPACIAHFPRASTGEASGT